jgi:hypothetical protein
MFGTVTRVPNEEDHGVDLFLQAHPQSWRSG